MGRRRGVIPRMAAAKARMSSDGAKMKLALRLLRVGTLCSLFFAAWTASLYLPHQNAWWRVSEGIVMAMALASGVQNYLRRVRLEKSRSSAFGEG